MLKIASLLLVALSTSALPAATVDDINPAARGLAFAPKPSPPVPDVVDDPAWLIATSGFCSNLNVVIKERDVGKGETEGDTAAHFMADIAFNYYPQTAVKFTDFPHHLAKTIEGDAAEADALVSSAWDHKNIALLEPTSTCGPEQGDQAWGISVFKVEEHRHCSDGETAWEGHPCVHYSGYVSAATSNFVNVNEGRFVCQLFVDSNATDQAELHAFIAKRLLVDWLSPPGGKYKGACRTGVQGVSAGQGVFQELWGKSENECREACEIQAVCQSYEHATMPNNYKRCELHSEPVTHTVPIPNTVCFVKHTRGHGYGATVPAGIVTG